MRTISPITVITLLVCVLTAGIFVPRSEAVYRSSNADSTLEIEAIDIAPSSTPTPDLTKPRSIVTGTALPTPVMPESTMPTMSATQEEPKVFFIFGLSQSDVDFGVVDPTNPVIRTSEFSLSSGNAQGMSLFTYQNHPLRIPNTQDFIPDSSCDDGQCSEIASSPWENTLTYGYGYRCDSLEGSEAICASDFTSEHSYRQFADLNQKESSLGILKAIASPTKVTGRITYKLNIPGTQKPGDYTNGIVLIAAPTF